MSRFLTLLFLAFTVLPSYANAAETRGLRVVAKDPATNQTGEVQLYNKSYAVIIGIDRYRNLPPDRQLKNAVKDAKGIEATLKKQFRFDKVYTLHDEFATRDNIMRLLTSELPKTIGKDDALFLFWAGHGNQEKTDDGELGYLIPTDGNSDGIYGNITMSQLRDDISKAIPAKHVFYAFDACYSGLLTTRSVDKKVNRNLAYLKDITKERVRQVLTAGGKGQEALDGGPRGHSVFTGRLIEILEATGDYITANEIQAILKEKVYQDARARGHEQTPGYGTLYGSGDFVFVPNIEQKVQDNKAEVARMEAELKAIQAQEEQALKFKDEQKRRETEAQRKAAEARLRAEQLKQQQLVDEQKRRTEEEQARARFEAEQKQKEQELTAAQRAEEQRIAALKAEVEKRKQAAGAATISSMTIQAAVDEIKRLNSQIDGIIMAFAKELNEGQQRIASRYDVEIKRLKQDEGGKKQALQRDEFETEGEFRQRLANHTGGYSTRVTELEKKKQDELDELEKHLRDVKNAQTAGLQDMIRLLSEKEYPLPAELLVLDLGQYDLNKQAFPVSITSKPASPVKVAVNGTIPLPRDAAKTFRQQYQAGAVRAQVAVAVGSGEVAKVAVNNDADNYLMEYVDGEFITIVEKRRRAEELRRPYTDQQTGLMWARNGNIADKRMDWNEAKRWTQNLSYAGYSDWRLPTRDELVSFKISAAWFNANGFSNIQSNWYWTGTNENDDMAWRFDMGDNMKTITWKNNRGYVWPVRDVKPAR